MGFYSLVAPWFACKTVFSSNPNRVASFRNEPICATCIAKVNAEREKKGLPLWPVPADAYAPAEEGAL